MINWAKNTIARLYFLFYHKLLQRPADFPITRQGVRVLIRWPAMAWAVALAVFGLTAGLLRGWWIIATVCIFVFAWWFIPHCIQSALDHRDDNQVCRTPAMLEWSEDRIEICSRQSSSPD